MNMLMNTDNLLKLFCEEKENGEKYKQLYHQYYSLYKNAQLALANKGKGTEKKIQEAAIRILHLYRISLKKKKRKSLN